jgi:hypothetical protein
MHAPESKRKTIFDPTRAENLRHRLAILMCAAESIIYTTATITLLLMHHGCQVILPCHFALVLAFCSFYDPGPNAFTAIPVPRVLVALASTVLARSNLNTIYRDCTRNNLT